MMTDLTPRERLGNRLPLVDMTALATLYAAEELSDSTGDADVAWGKAYDACDTLTRHAWRMGYANPRTERGQEDIRTHEDVIRHYDSSHDRP